jgi:hypothetical protein
MFAKPKNTKGVAKLNKSLILARLHFDKVEI